MPIHPSAVVSPKAEVDSSVEIGPYAVIGDHVRIGPGTVIHQQVTLAGHTTVGRENTFYPGAILGTEPQDLKFRGEVSHLEIGDRNTFREYVTVNLGTELGGGYTRVGNHNLIMAYCHIAHDCQIGDDTILANLATLGGHVRVEDGANFGGMVGVHHFVTVGRCSFIGGMSRIFCDVPPFMIVEGNPARVRGINLVGLRRKGFTEERIDALKSACRKLYRDEEPMVRSLEAVAASEYCTDDVQYLIQFIRNSEKGKYGRALEAERRP